MMDTEVSNILRVAITVAMVAAVIAIQVRGSFGKNKNPITSAKKEQIFVALFNLATAFVLILLAVIPSKYWPINAANDLFIPMALGGVMLANRAIEELKSTLQKKTFSKKRTSNKPPLDSPPPPNP